MKPNVRPIVSFRSHRQLARMHRAQAWSHLRAYLSESWLALVDRWYLRK